jgi:hypothetical protein
MRPSAKIYLDLKLPRRYVFIRMTWCDQTLVTGVERGAENSAHSLFQNESCWESGQKSSCAGLFPKSSCHTKQRSFWHVWMTSGALRTIATPCSSHPSPSWILGLVLQLDFFSIQSCLWLMRALSQHVSMSCFIYHKHACCTVVCKTGHDDDITPHSWRLSWRRSPVGRRNRHI